VDAVAVGTGWLHAQAEEARVGLGHLADEFAVGGFAGRGAQQLDTFGAGQPGADEKAVTVPVRAQEGERVAMLALLQGLDGGTFGGALRGGGQVSHGVSPEAGCTDRPVRAAEPPASRAGNALRSVVRMRPSRCRTAPGRPLRPPPRARRGAVPP